MRAIQIFKLNLSERATPQSALALQNKPVEFTCKKRRERHWSFLFPKNKIFVHQLREIGIQQREHSETKLKEPLEARNSHLVLAGRFVVTCSISIVTVGPSLGLLGSALFLPLQLRKAKQTATQMLMTSAAISLVLLHNIQIPK